MDSGTMLVCSISAKAKTGRTPLAISDLAGNLVGRKVTSRLLIVINQNEGAVFWWHRTEQQLGFQYQNLSHNVVFSIINEIGKF